MVDGRELGGSSSRQWRRRFGMFAPLVLVLALSAGGVLFSRRQIVSIIASPYIDLGSGRAPGADGTIDYAAHSNIARAGINRTTMGVDPRGGAGAEDEPMLILSDASSTFASKSSVPNANKNTTDSAPAPTLATLRGTAVIGLRGQLGNHLATFAYFYAVRTIALDEFNLDLTLHVRKQDHPQANSAAKNAMCLKSLQNLDFDECDWRPNLSVNGTVRGEMCLYKINYQNVSLHDLSASQGNNETIMKMAQNLKMDVSMRSTSGIRSSLKEYAAMLRDQRILDHYHERNAGWSKDEQHPFLFTDEAVMANEHFVDEFYSRGLPEYLSFNDETKFSSGCCNQLPGEDEQVFHYRNFHVDLPKRHMQWGGAELRPDYAASMLSASLPPGTNVAVVAGRSPGPQARTYGKEFSNRSFVARDIKGQTSIQDFCFLAHARAGLWGTRQSSYVSWASYIAKGLRNATLYGVNYPARDRKVDSRVATNDDLARIVHYPIFDVPNEAVW